MSAGTVVIKKYPNRRLYDTSASRYINLEDIAAFIRNGQDVQVVDAQSGDDVTRVTLTQIIMDDAKQQPTGLPLEMLKQLIISSDLMGREFIMWYLKSAYDAYQTVQAKLHTGLRDVQTAAVSPINTVKNFLQSQLTVAPPPPPSSAAATAELLQLRQRLAELEARMAKPAPRISLAKAKAPAKRRAVAKKRAAKKRR